MRITVTVFASLVTFPTACGGPPSGADDAGLGPDAQAWLPDGGGPDAVSPIACTSTDAGAVTPPQQPGFAVALAAPGGVASEALGVQAVAFAPDGDLIVGSVVGPHVLFAGVPLWSRHPLGEAFVARLGPDGAARWARTFADAPVSRVAGVAVDRQDRTWAVIVAGPGATIGTVTLGPQGGSVLLRLGPGGDTELAVAFGQLVVEAMLAAGDEIFLAGSFEGTSSVGGVPLSSVGRTTFVTALDGDGVARFVTTSTGTSEDAATALAVAADGSMIVGGRFRDGIGLGGDAYTAEGNVDGFLWWLDASGAPVRSRWIHGPGDEAISGLALAAGGVVAVGAFTGTIDWGEGPVGAVEGFDAFVLRLGADGAPLGSVMLAGADLQLAQNVVAAADGSLLISGRYRGTFSVGGVALPHSTQESGFLLELDAAGVPVSGQRLGGDVGAGVTRMALDAGGRRALGGGAGGPGGFRIGDTYVATSSQLGAYVAVVDPIGWPASDGTLSVSVEGGGRVLGPGGLDCDGASCGASCTHAYQPGTMVTLAAEPDATSLFLGWEGACTGTGAVCIVDVSRAHAVRARFSPPPRAGGWSRANGGDSTGVGRRVVRLTTGNVLVVGDAGGGSTLDLGGGALGGVGTSDLFLASYAANGAHLWSTRTFGVDQLEVAAAAATDDGGVVVAGAYQANQAPQLAGAALPASPDVWRGFVARFDRDGGLVWADTVGASLQLSLHDIAVDASGRVVASGAADGTLTFAGEMATSAPGALLAFVARWDAAGGQESLAVLPCTQRAFPMAVAVDGDELLVAGFFVGALTLGDTTLSVSDSFHGFLARLDADLAPVAGRQLGAADTPMFVRDAVAIAPGELVVVGEVAGLVDLGAGPVHAGPQSAFVMRVSTTGPAAWAKVLPGTVRPLVAVGGGAVVVAGGHAGAVLEGHVVWGRHDDMFVARLDADGEVQDAWGFGTADTEELHGLDIGAQGEILLTGRMGPTLHLGPGEIHADDGMSVTGFVAGLQLP